MLKKRIIPCLDVKNGRTVKGVNFKSLRDAGDAVELAAYYSDQGADELVLLDITASLERRKTVFELAERVGEALSIPYTIGGGIADLSTAERLLSLGADKLSINSAALARPTFIEDLAKAFGSQCVVVAVDVKQFQNGYRVYSHGGSRDTGLSLDNWLKEIYNRGAGEVLLTSMDGDGTKAGFDLALYRSLADFKLPLIASGGAGKMEHFKEVLELPQVDAALAASLFHFRELEVPDLKKYLKNQKIAMR